MNYNFNPTQTKDNLVQWIRNWFEQNGPDCMAVIGISGGKDSSVVAALCVEALGKQRVFGVLMPQGVQKDMDDSLKLVNHLQIKYIVANIGNAYSSLYRELSIAGLNITPQTQVNLPPRLRMATLYAVSQSVNGRVANTCNLSEDWVGYATRWGDSVGDFAPLAELTVGEVKSIGRELGLPEDLIEKTPADGLCGKTDEDNLGFSYATLDKYIRTGEIDDVDAKGIIDILHKKNLFKLKMMPHFNPELQYIDSEVMDIIYNK